MTVAISALPAASAPLSVVGDVPATDAGVTSRFSPAQLAGSLSLMDYGAVGDGSTDDLAALNAAIAAANSGNYKVIYFPPGKTFKVSATPTAPTSPVLFLIEGTLAPSATLTLPALATLQFRGSGQLAPTAGVTTILSGLNAPLVQIFSGTGTVSFTGNSHVEHYYPQWWGVVGDSTSRAFNAAAGGATTLTGLSSTASFAVGQGIGIRAGKTRTQVFFGSDSGWATSNANVTFTQDAANHTTGTAGAKSDCATTFVMGQELVTFTLGASQDWSAYDEIRFDCKVANTSNFTKLTPGGMVVAIKNTAGTVVSRLSGNGNLDIQATFRRYSIPLDQQTPLTDVKSIEFLIDRLQHTSGRPVSLGFADNGGSISSTGVGFTVWIDNVWITADLYTTVASVPSSTSLTITTPLGAALPDTALVVIPSNFAGVYHDDAAPLNACIAAVPDFGEIVFTLNLNIPIASTITIAHRQGMRFTGATGGGSDAATLSLAAPHFYWVGRSGQDMFFFNQSRGFAVSGLSWTCSGPMPPSSAVNLDMTGSLTTITSDDRFDRCYVEGPLGYPNYTGFAISRIARVNCEFVMFRDVWVATSSTWPGAGIGFYIGGSFNAKSILFESCSTGNGAVGWRTDAGSFLAKRCHADYNGLDLVVNNSAEPIMIEDCNFEFSGGAVYNASQYPVYLKCNRWSSILSGAPGLPGSQAGAILTGATAGAMMLVGNKIAPHVDISSPVLFDPACIASTVYSLGNRYAYPLASANFNESSSNSTAVNVVSIDDVFDSGNTTTKGQVLYGTDLYGADDSWVPKHVIGRGTSGRYATNVRKHVAVDNDANGTVLGGWAELKGGGLHLKHSLITSLIAPVQSAAALAAGGSLVSGTPYYWTITATTVIGGETVKSNEQTLTPSGGNLKGVISWASVTGATGYKVYRSTTSGTYTTPCLVTTISSGATLTYTDTGSALTTGAPPATDTTGTWDFTTGNTVKDQVGGIVLIDAASADVTVLGFTNPSDFKASNSQTASAVWEFRRIDTSANVVKLAPFTRGLLVENMDSSSWVYLNPGEYMRLFADGQSSSKYWRIDGNNPIAWFTKAWASTTAIDWTRGTKQSVTLTANTILTFANIRAGEEYTLVLIQGGIGSFSVTSWPATAKFHSGVTPTLTAAAGSVDILRGVSDGTNIYFTVVALDMR